MNNTELNNLSIEDKKRLLIALANGSIDKSDLHNSEMIAIISSRDGWNLIHCECWGNNDYKHNGKEVSKEEFERLMKIYDAVFPHRANVVYINEKKREI
jgi:hypothetical protein